MSHEQALFIGVWAASVQKDYLLAKGSVLVNLLGLSKKISNDQELIQSDPISCPQNQKGNN